MKQGRKRTAQSAASCPTDLLLCMTRGAQSLHSHACSQGLCGFASALDGFGLLALQPGVAGTEQFRGFGELLLKAAYSGVQAGYGCLNILAQAVDPAGFESIYPDGLFIACEREVFLFETVDGFSEAGDEVVTSQEGVAFDLFMGQVAWIRQILAPCLGVRLKSVCKTWLNLHGGGCHWSGLVGWQYTQCRQHIA